jgi:hypothetical protein
MGNLFEEIKKPVLKLEIKIGVWGYRKLFFIDKFLINNDLK